MTICPHSKPGTRRISWIGIPGGTPRIFAGFPACTFHPPRRKHRASQDSIRPIAERFPACFSAPLSGSSAATPLLSPYSCFMILSQHRGQYCRSAASIGATRHDGEIAFLLSSLPKRRDFCFSAKLFWPFRKRYGKIFLSLGKEGNVVNLR